MFLRRFYDDGLAQATYLIGCQRSGECLVIDPNRDVAPLIAAAEGEGLRITHVTETHIHADFTSGARELAARTGATLYLSAEGGPDWQYAFAATDGATLVRDGDVITVGNIKVEVMHTPGHTPEHISFLVTDGAVATEPIGIATGDFVFVGDVGRPDLLEKAAGVANTMEAGARQLFTSLERFRALPDHVQVWPGHGAGSACGKALGAVPTSTVGYEKRFNWGVAETDEARFVAAILDGQPEPPRYFAEMKRLNKVGPRILHGFTHPERLGADRIAALAAGGAQVVDLRATAAYADAHLPGTLSIPLNRSFSTWAGWLLPYETDLYVVAESAPQVDAAVRELAMIGLDQVAGYTTFEAVASLATGRVPQTTPDELDRTLLPHGVTLIDVRGQSEWDAGHIPGAKHIHLGYLANRLEEVPREGTVVLQCQGGARSAIAASVLRARGYENVVNLQGGYAAWRMQRA